MKLDALNPFVYSANLVERVDKTDLCRAYVNKLIYLISGELSVNVPDEKPLRLAPGALLFIPAGLPYRLKSKYMRAVVINFDAVYGEYESTFIPPSPAAEFNEDACHKSTLPHLDKLLYLSDAESQRDEFIALTEIFTSAQGEYLSTISARVKLALIKLTEALDDNALPPFMVESLDKYIRENCSDEISGTEIGAVFGYHPYYISTMLKERRGMTVKQYVNDYRLKLAKRMLAYGNTSIADIADACGFSDASYFAKIFKADTGMSPKDYRNEFKEKYI